MATKKRPMATGLPIPDREEDGPVELSAEDSDATDPTTDPDDIEVEELEDGSAVVHDEKGEPGEDDSDFYSNILDKIDPGLLGRTATSLLESIKRDKDARKKRDEQYAEGIRRTGLGEEAPGGASFVGASRAVHPVLVEACIDFSARAMKELFPAKGPVKTHIIGKQTDEKLQKAERKKAYMNWQLTKQAREYRTELEQLTTQLPLGGSQYMKVWQDQEFERPRFEFVPIDDVYLPFACSDFYTSPRLTHVQHLTKFEFETRVRNGVYEEVKGADATGTTMPDESAAQKATDKIEGRTDEYNQDGIRDVFEVQVAMDWEGNDKEARKDRPAPYIVSVDDSLGKILSIRRNWKEGDEKQEKLHWIVEFAFVPWRGAYAIGIGQAMGSLAGAATGSLRALLDSAHIKNFPAALKLKGNRTSSQTLSLEATGLTEIEGPAAMDDIRKLAMPLPFPEPSMMLFELMKYCADRAQSVVNTADEKIGDQASQMPVGTALAMIEQGSITFSSIHSRMHESQRRVLEILHRLDAEYLEDENTVEELGELIVKRSDFEGPMDVLPVSDPNIFSDTQRYAQQQAVIQLKQLFPTSFKDNTLLERTLQLLNYPDYEDVLNVPLKPEQRLPVRENVVAREPMSQLKVYPNEDDLAHLKVHLSFMSSPILCANPMMAMPALPKLIQHCCEHIAAHYEKHAAAASEAAKATKLAMGGAEESQAEGVILAEQEIVKELGPMWEHLVKLGEQAKQWMPPPPPDPMTASAKIKADADMANHKETLAHQEKIEAQKMQAEQAAEQQREQQATQREAMAVQAETAANQAAEAATAARHTEEMAVSNENARKAEESEQRKQMLEFLSEKMREEMESMRNTQDNQTQVIVQALAAHAKAESDRRIAEATASAESGKKAPASEPPVDDSRDMILRALFDLMQQQSQPRSYAVKKNPDGTLVLTSGAGTSPSQPSI
jgi:hypothetical protein